MKTKTSLLTLLFILTHFVLQAQNKKLMGIWYATNGTKMIFDPNGTVKVANDIYAYKVQGNQLGMFNQAGQSIIYTYAIKHGKLYLYLPGTGTYVLTRKKTAKTYSTQQGQAQRTGYGGGNSALNRRLYGSFCSYSSSGYGGSSSYSTTQKVTFDGQGHYSYGSESSYSGGGDGYSGGDGGYSGTYVVKNNRVVILTATDGSQYQVEIYFVQQSGEITELKYNGTVYGKSLCD